MAWIAEGLHRIPDGHVVPAGASVPSLRSTSREHTLQVGHGAVIQGAIEHAGGVILGRDVRVWHHVHGGHEVVVGAHSQTQAIRATGRIVVQDGARTGDLHAGSDVLLLGTCHVGSVEAGGDIVIVGSPDAGAMTPGGRIATRPW